MTPLTNDQLHGKIEALELALNQIFRQLPNQPEVHRTINVAAQNQRAPMTENAPAPLIDAFYECIDKITRLR